MIRFTPNVFILLAFLAGEAFSAERVVIAIPLSLQTKITGSDQAAARLIASINMP